MTLAPVPPVLDADRYVAYQPTAAGATDFSITFPLWGDNTDVAVYVNSVLQSTSAYSIYSPLGQISLLPKPLTDASGTPNAYVRFNSTITNSLVEIYGNRRPRRPIQAISPFGTRDFNSLFSDVISTMREIWSALSRSFQVPVGETAFVLPPAAQRAGKILIFDPNGAPYMADPSSFAQTGSILAAQAAATQAQTYAAQAAVNAAVDFAPPRVVISTTTHTLQAANTGKLHVFANASGCTVTVPVGLPDTSFFPMLVQSGAGLVSISGSAGVTVNNPYGHTHLSPGPSRGELATEQLNIFLLDGRTQ